jgi:hypothetical protein
MAEKFISRGFKGRGRETATALNERIPPGQYETKDFPVLSAGPTPRTSLERWGFSIYGEGAKDLKWTWDEFRKLPRETVTVDIHCVTKWSKLDTVWTGVSVDTLLKGINLDAQPAVGYLVAFCDGGYTNSEFTVIIPQAIAQTTSSGNMTTLMLESARFHLKAADVSIMEGDRIAALRQINLAEIQLSLLNMGSQGTSMDPSQAIEFITGGSLSSTRMGANCVIDNQAMVRCMQ